MIARPVLPAEFVVWNAMTGASHSGPFSMYRYCPSTRIWEYPWAWHAAPARAGMRVLDVGGAMSGFSLTLARAGADVLNVDPDPDWQSPDSLLNRWAQSFGVRVRTFRGEASAVPEPDASYDVAYCLSVIEHIPHADARARLMSGVRRLLRRGGLFVITIDVAFKLRPFSDIEGTPELRNVDVAELIAASSFSLVSGDPTELIGMPGFDAATILSRAQAGEFLTYSTGLATQCFVLQAV